MLEGMRSAAHDQTPILRPRTLRDSLRRALRGAPVAHRHRP